MSILTVLSEQYDHHFYLEYMRWSCEGVRCQPPTTGQQFRHWQPWGILFLFKSSIDHSLVSTSRGDGRSALSSGIIHYVRKRATSLWFKSTQELHEIKLRWPEITHNGISRRWIQWINVPQLLNLPLNLSSKRILKAMNIDMNMKLS